MQPRAAILDPGVVHGAAVEERLLELRERYVKSYDSGLEIEAFTVARDRSTMVWILNLP